MLDIITMPWLPRATESFRSEVKALAHDAPDVGTKLIALSTCFLGEREALLLSRKLRQIQAEDSDLRPLADYELSIVSNCTTDLVVDALPAAALRHHVNLKLTVGGFDQVLQEAINPDSDIYKNSADGIFLMLDHRWYGRNDLKLETELFVEQSIEKLSTVLNAIEQNSPSKQIFLQTVAAPPLQFFGSYDRSIGSLAMRDVDALNTAIVSLSQNRGCHIVDVATLAENIGTANFFDLAAYNLYKLPFSSDAIPLFCDWVARLLAAARGKSRKCLVLDLDNTLWGGVIGDDGLDGIMLGQGSALGEAFVSIQQYAKSLKERGIILGVCSKNNEKFAREAFEQHPEMILRLTDIAIFQANWHDKASNLEAIASALGIGIDALVFLDDNPLERATVRTSLPLVAVPEVGQDPSDYITILGSTGYFESLSFTEEDVNRASTYAANAKRQEVRAKARDIDEFLSSLKMEFVFSAFTEIDHPRILQLINKTNQFNLTTVRYTDAEIREIRASSRFRARFCRLKDKFSDFGIIGVVIIKIDNLKCWDVQTWLMSCRVLGRGVESAMLADLIDLAKGEGAEILKARFVPTSKNSMVSDMYDRLGFERTRGVIGETAEFRLNLNDMK